MRIGFGIRYNKIESEWLKYKDELLIAGNPYFETISLTTKNLNLHSDRNEFGGYDITDLSIENLKAHITDSLIPAFCTEQKRYSELKEVDKLINKSIEIDDNTLLFSIWQSLPFRKVIVARDSNNPNYDLIFQSMKNYCDEQYKIGLKEDFEQLCKLKIVFTKLFGNVN